MSGRFAPSPTSDLHLGNLRTALLAWAFARRDALRFVVRVEDLDQQRVAAAPAVAERHLADLAAIGIDWDGEVVWQSERLDHYRNALSRLDTYECFCSRREIAEAAQAPHDGVRAYPGTCRDLSQTQRDERRRTRVPALRVRANAAEVTVRDVHAGEVTGIVDDFVVQRGDGTAAYNLAAVVDDGLQGITQVTRGRDLLDSSPRQAWLATWLGFPVPEYVHVGLAVTSHGDRLAKRTGSVTLDHLGRAGFDAADVVRRLVTSIGLPAATRASDLLTLDDAHWQAADPWSDWIIDGSLPPAGPPA